MDGWVTGVTPLIIFVQIYVITAKIFVFLAKFLILSTSVDFVKREI